ncbi:hypothetical protein [Rhodanobacter hydrolyticus]|uniref:Uncharacterized protein n=1 Tax=Rhodanobacter hydrolyticus TaxID=2250595 RepID=A0ABW8J3L4_9GAMM
MTTTFMLDPDTWDLVVGPDGNYVTLTGAAQIQQDVCSAIRTFQGECWYDNTQGMPYFESIFGQPVASSFLKKQVQNAALTVPTVTGATLTNLTISGRKLTGTVVVTTSTSTTPIEVNF